MISKMLKVNEARINDKIQKAYEDLDTHYSNESKVRGKKEDKKVNVRRCSWINCDNEISATNNVQKFCPECENHKRVSDLVIYDIPSKKRQYFVKYQNLKELKQLIGMD